MFWHHFLSLVGQTWRLIGLQDSQKLEHLFHMVVSRCRVFYNVALCLITIRSCLHIIRSVFTVYPCAAEGEPQPRSCLCLVAYDRAETSESRLAPPRGEKFSWKQPNKSGIYHLTAGCRVEVIPVLLYSNKIVRLQCGQSGRMYFSRCLR